MPEDTPRRYAAGVGAQAAGRLVHAFAGWAILVALARALSPAAVGVFDSYLALYLILDVLVDGGSGMALLRRASACPAALLPTLRRALAFRAVTAGAAAAGALLYQALDPRIGAANPWGWMAAATFFTHLPGTWGVAFHLRLSFGFPSAARAGGGLVSLGLVLAALAAGARDPMLFLFLALLVRPLSHAAFWWKGRQLLRDYRAGSRPAEPGFFRESLTLGTGGLLREAYARLDTLLLRWLLGAEVAGLYAPARRTLNLALLLPSFLLTVAVPPLAARARSEPAVFRARVNRLAGRLALFALPAGLACLPLIPWYLGWFGGEYAGAAATLRILAAAAMLAYPGMVFTTALVARGAARTALGVSAAALGVNLGLNLLLIPGFSLAGAAAARAAAEAAALAASAAGHLRRTTGWSARRCSSR